MSRKNSVLLKEENINSLYALCHYDLFHKSAYSNGAKICTRLSWRYIVLYATHYIYNKLADSAELDKNNVPAFDNTKSY